MNESLWLLALIAAVGAGCFYGGWRSARSYLQAAQAVSSVTNAVASQSNSFTSTMDKTEATCHDLKVAIDRNTEVMDDRYRALEAALQSIFQGFERSGLVRGARAAPPRQVGEERTE